MIGNGLPNPMMMAGGDPLDDLGKIDRSLRLRATATAYLSRVQSAPTAANIYTISGWIKRGKLGAIQSLFSAGSGTLTTSTSQAFFGADDSFAFQTSGGNTGAVASPAFYRDPSAHLHCHVTVNGTTASLYVDGSLVASGTVTNAFFNVAGQPVYLGHQNYSGTNRFLDAVLSNFCFVDGQALPPTAFAVFHPKTGQWRPKSKAAIRASVLAGGGARNGWGANGFFLTFDDRSTTTTVGYDRSQSDTDTTGNNFTTTNVSVTAGVTDDSLTDTPTNNYCTLNPVAIKVGSGYYASEQGNLRASDNASTFGYVPGTIAVSSGKWFWEVTATMVGGSCAEIGIKKLTAADIDDGNGVAGSPGAYSYDSGGNKRNYTSPIPYGSGYANGDIIGVALDLDNGTLSFYKNGTPQGIAFSGISGSFTPAIGDYQQATQYVLDANFGQRQFSYPIYGFKALCSKNLQLSGSIPSSGTFIGNASTDGPSIDIGGCPETLTINGNAVTFGVHADRLANGFKLRSASGSYNAGGSNTWVATFKSPTLKSLFRYQNAKGN